ncbi:MAG: hypothetical protein C0501_02815 [Isosphaera sp.]|nr:hypothetical protein [Isosphaera sp.]
MSGPNEPEEAPPAPAGGHSVTSSTLWEGIAPLGASAGAVPGYEVLGELGRGATGIVYKARVVKPPREVALKLMVFGDYAGRADLARFRTHAQAVARIDHPGLVKILDIGEHQGVPYLCLELCPGGSLADKLRDRLFAPPEAARTAEQLARAVQAAHDRNVVHRGLKPADVLLAADGTPKVADLGLARRGDEAGGPAGPRAVTGPFGYLAPEQAAGRTGEVGPAADVYALGAILYEMLTGRPPFLAATLTDTFRQVLHRDPVAPRVLQPDIPPDLEAVCLRCLEKDPRDRYPTAEALADDLARFLRGGRPAVARPASPLARAARWARRNPAAAVLLVALAGAVLLGLVGLTHLWLDAAADRREAVRERDAAEADARARRDAADRDRDRAADSLRDAEGRRDQALSYVESVLDLKRFGRSLARQPVRKDFDLRVAAVPGGKEPFRLEVTPQVDCHLTVFYALPDPNGPDTCLLVYPTRKEKGNLVAGGKTVTVPDDPAAALPPAGSVGGSPTLYVVASERDWLSEVKPDRVYKTFPSFSPQAEAGLAAAVRDALEGPGNKAGRVAEEVVVSGARAGKWPGK